MACVDWKVRREITKSGFQSYEVFTAPDGREWLCASVEVAQAYVLPRTRGLRPRPIRLRSTKERQAVTIKEVA